jgi:hypothetical protein
MRETALSLLTIGRRLPCSFKREKSVGKAATCCHRCIQDAAWVAWLIFNSVRQYLLAGSQAAAPDKRQLRVSSPACLQVFSAAPKARSTAERSTSGAFRSSRYPGTERWRLERIASTSTVPTALKRWDAFPGFANVWRKTLDGWKLERVLSYGHPRLGDAPGSRLRGCFRYRKLPQLGH